MKIAVISDIHGNIDALDAVMKEIEALKCDKIFALGDYVMAGPEPKKTLERFIQMHDSGEITMIQGNTDLMIAELDDEIWEKLKVNAPVMAEALKNDREILSDTQKEFLKTLPATLEKDIEGLKILLTHGSPRRNNEDILPDISPEKLEEILKDTDADIILCGHTHIPCGFQTESKKTVVNAGSVGRPFTGEPKACFLTIDINGKEAVFEHHLVQYDNELAASKLRKRGFNGAEKLAMTLINPKERHF